MASSPSNAPDRNHATPSPLMDAQTMLYLQQVARDSGREAAEQVGQIIRSELQADISIFRTDLRDDIEGMLARAISRAGETFLGDMTPAGHISSHARTASTHSRIDRVKDSLWGNVVKAGFAWLVVIVVGATAFSDEIQILSAIKQAIGL